MCAWWAVPRQGYAISSTSGRAALCSMLPPIAWELLLCPCACPEGGPLLLSAAACLPCSAAAASASASYTSGACSLAHAMKKSSLRSAAARLRFNSFSCCRQEARGGNGGQAG